MFNEFFSTVYSSDNINYEDLQVDVLHPDLLFEISTTQSEVENILVNLDAKKATGVDGIPARILKSCARELSMSLTKLFNLSFSLGEVRLTWKRANDTPIFKDNAKENVENYISFSCYQSWANVKKELLSIVPSTLIFHLFLLIGSMAL